VVYVIPVVMLIVSKGNFAEINFKSLNKERDHEEQNRREGK
jgi:hypothetical protein